MATANKLLFGRIIKVTIDNGQYKGTFDYKDLEIHFEVPFDDDSKPNESKVTIFNLGTSTINKIRKGSSMTIQAGYKDDYGVLAIGKVTKVLTSRDGVNKQTVIHMKEGDDYSHIKVTADVADSPEKYYVNKRYKLKKPIKTTTQKKVKLKSGKIVTRTSTKTINYKTVREAKYRKQSMKITFKKNTSAQVIIKKLTRLLDIKLAQLSLPRNKIYKSGYTVTGSIEKKLEEVVKDCGAALYYRRGRMVIRSITSGDDERFTLQESTGLIDSPAPFEDENLKGYTVKCLLQHRITTASIIEVKSKTAKGKYRAKRGKHYFDGNDFMTETDVI
ncbi:hypothetical protein P8917_00890 [Bacillus atrophaeus]|uniref:phage protein n=1 Tax=Bacillus subtilis group TaxID=653685 RepID=UPI00227E9361|nr:MULTISPECIES: hypothetical protein [Bacillus subtilis group]MCY7919564.1 hypothetical protein [Bacillus vallismortis]MCY8813683.1 hypothetical protein [Bacillus atrophaeus]MCY8820244.1 hypothetical protein [Bacillus atrophaeus]MCY8828632.1 hypothetical protein [Bacillus atrophaeus]MCY8832719.1 hypothetical protein [Bacillus atrophaeus]